MPATPGADEQTAAAEQRFQDRRSQRQRNVEALRGDGGLVETNSPERLASRIDRLSRYLTGEGVLPAATGAPFDPERMIDSALLRVHEAGLLDPVEAESAPEAAGIVIERIINAEDFVDIRYLEAGTAASRAVGRVVIRDGSGRRIGYGTGSLVSPRLLLTNNHVLANSAAAAASMIEFNYQDGIDGRPLQPVTFGFDPATFFVTDQQLDFALVAVRATAAQLAQFSFNPLVPAEGTVVVGEAVTIIQHPRGEMKQVALRDNHIVDIVDRYLHYETDTEPGSSGSPVFNDQWELVALHHASVPAPDRAELGDYMNEGIRAGRILAFVESRRLSGAAADLAAQLAERERVRVTPSQAAPDVNGRSVDTSPASGLQVAPSAGAVRLTIPLELTMELGTPAPAPARTAPIDEGNPQIADEAIAIDPDYRGRRGYDPEFLGGETLRVPLPGLSDAMLDNVAINSEATGDPGYVLPYHNFSVVMNRRRRLAYFTAVNIDGRRARSIRREADRWVLDPRIPAEEQAGEAVYEDNPLDRGHLVRRLDPAWGDTYAASKRASDDTFHFTNCSPQHREFNQSRTLWAGLENYLLDHAANEKFAVSVFTGPVLADDDDEYRGVQLPREFWKVAVMVKKPEGSLSATAYLLSQAHLISGLEVDPEAFVYSDYRTYQVPVATIAALTGLDFGDLPEADPLSRREAFGAREVTAAEDVVV